MSLKYNFWNIKGLDKKISAIAGQVDEQAFAVLVRGAYSIAAEAKRSIAEKGSNSHTETRYNPRREQKVSEPGSPPNQDLGTLSKSIGVSADRTTGEVRVGTNYKVGKYLEFGVNGDENARPWLRPATDKIRPMIESDLKKLKAIK